MAAAPNDDAVARLLRRSLASGSPETRQDCPDAEILSAFAEHTLNAQEARDVEDHVASCRSCARVLAMVIASEPELTAAADTSGRGWSPWRWVVPLATAATVAGLWVALTRDRIPPEPATSITSSASAPPVAAAPSAAPTGPANERRAEMRPAPPPSLPATVQNSAPLIERQAEPQAAPTAAAQERAVAAPPPPASLAETVRVIPSIEVSSPIDQTRWRVLGNVIQRSTDAGATWSTDYTAARDVLAGAAVNGDVAWMVGREGLVLRRSASGWTVTTAPTSTDLSAVEAASATEATVRPASGAGFYTLDGGATWTPR